MKIIKKFLEYQSQKIDWFLKRIQHPGQQIKNQIQRVNALSIQLSLLIQAFLKEKDLILKNSIRALETVSPLATLNRGYAIVSHQQSGDIIQSITQIDPHSTLQIRFKDGTIRQEKEKWIGEAVYIPEKI
jgi:exodeoxyribonuclease VII large subunit